MHRHLEDRSATGSPSRNIGVGGGGRMVSRSANVGSKRSPPSPDKTETRSNGKDHHHQNQRQNGLDHHHHQRTNRLESTAQIHSEIEINNGEKTTAVEVIEWPRIYIALSRKEKEEDFLAMKGTKLPHRPRKRAKNIDKGLQVGFFSSFFLLIQICEKVGNDFDKSFGVSWAVLFSRDVVV